MKTSTTQQSTPPFNTKGLEKYVEPRVLHVAVTKQWFDLLRSGYKKEEYRGLCDFWIARLLECNYPFEWIEDDEKKVHFENMVHDICAGHPWEEVLKGYHCVAKPWDIVRVRNGYGGKVPQLDIKFESLTIGKPQQGLAPKESLDRPSFIIHLGDIVSAANLKP